LEEKNPFICGVLGGGYFLFFQKGRQVGINLQTQAVLQDVSAKEYEKP